MGNYLTSGDGAADPGYLVLLRHGQTPWSVSGQYTGRTDVSLTEQGRQQALAGGERLREVFPGGFSDGCVFTSPLRRASETAQLAGYAVSETLEDLAEWDYGRAEGRKREEVSAALAMTGASGTKGLRCCLKPWEATGFASFRTVRS